MIAKGRKASGGKALGRIYERHRIKESVDASIGHGEDERERLYAALARAKEALTALSREESDRMGENGDIFLIHSLMLEDEDFVSVLDRALSETHTAEYALKKAEDAAARALLAAGDALVGARCDDIHDACDRVRHELSGQKEESYPDGDFIYLADEITPSELLALEKSHCVGIVLRGGSHQSHAAILAAAMSIPMLVEARTAAEGGELALLDADEGIFIPSPDEEAVSSFLAWREEKKRRDKELDAYRALGFSYPSGRVLTVAANIGSPSECERAAFLGAEGIGLFRSEFLFMEREVMPSEEEQFFLYRKILEAFPNRRVVIRTIDVGADKVPSWCFLEDEKNPALGLRGIRLSLMRPDIFLPQLRALIRASVYGELVILLPMVTSVEEVKRVAELMETLKTALAEEGFSVGQYTLGVMIETPAAALIARELSEIARYFSIGTNDLLQYTVAIDREHPTLGASCDAHHPALLRLISETVAAAHECGVTVAICGELAGDAALTEWLLSLEIDTLSVSPSKLLPLKEEIARVLKAKP